MPDELKKSHKGKHDPKDQRKPRQRHTPSEKPEKKIDKKSEEPQIPKKPVYEDPGPEFYKNLKRETDEILKITEEADSKYKKKEIQNNWSKYEMPIESYEEIEENENLGADYEKLIQASVSVGGHFQFKHEKSWDTDTGPSLYDKYFEIDMQILSTALSTIPFFERNNIEESIFTETDILNMNNRATKYKRKYYNDKSYTTPELEAQENILNNMRDNDPKENVENNPSQSEYVNLESKILDKPIDIVDDTRLECKDDDAIATTPLSKIITELNNDALTKLPADTFKQIKPDVISSLKDNIDVDDDNVDHLILGNTVNKVDVKTSNVKQEEESKKDEMKQTKVVEPSKQPVIQSPEDLEKWLDDFLEE